MQISSLIVNFQMFENVTHLITILPSITTGNPMYAKCQGLCRVQNIEHSAKLLFAECLPKSTRQTDDTQRKKTLLSAGHVTLGKPTFAECHVGSTRQIASRAPHTPAHARYYGVAFTTVIVCRVPARGHLANISLPSATQLALGKHCHVTRPLNVTVIICRVPGCGTRQRFINAECNYNGTRHFAECPL